MLVTASRSPFLSVMASILALSVATAHAETQGASAGQTANKPFTVAMRVDVQSQNRLARRSILPGDRARSGERISVTVWADQPVYLYVVSYDPKGWSELFFPSAQSARLLAEERVRIPENGGTFSLVGEPGDVTLRVVGSREPIDESAAKELRLRWPLFGGSEGSRGSEDKQQKKEPPPPPREPDRAQKRDAESGTRGGPQSTDERARTISSQSNGSEQAWLWFTFRQDN